MSGETPAERNQSESERSDSQLSETESPTLESELKMMIYKIKVDAESFRAAGERLTQVATGLELLLRRYSE